jgi:phenylalanyl-tRNA synthetase alpha chain
MKEQLSKLQKDFEKGLKNVSGMLHLDELEQTYFGRKSGSFTALAKEMKDLSSDMKKEIGKLMNDVRTNVKNAIEAKRVEFQREEMGKIADTESIDVTQPLLSGKQQGHIHPITQTLWELESIAQKMGFIVEDGPEIESDYHIFTALNIPEYHPARDAQDTFYIKGEPHWTMRSHVSGMQVRQMRQYGAPLRAAHIGRVFRNEALDATHGHTFYQFDSILVDKNITVGHLIGVIKTILEELYKRKVELRIRTGYFPFVEPGFEIEMNMTIGVGKNKKTKWIEIAPGGLVHPNVIKSGGLDPDEYDGFAFSLGVDRLVMAKYGIEDIRHIHSGDLRFLQQF